MSAWPSVVNLLADAQRAERDIAHRHIRERDEEIEGLRASLLRAREEIDRLRLELADARRGR